VGAAAASEGGTLGVILAAGKGTRLSPFSERLPKPLLPLLGRPLIEYQLAALREVGIRRAIVVVGHLGAEIVRHLGDGRGHGLELTYVEQGPTLGIAHALARVEALVDRPMLVLLGDIYFVHERLERMLTLLDDGADAVLAVREEPDAAAIRRNFVVLEDDEGLVRRVIEKPHHPRSRLKGCGVYLFRPHFFDALRRTPRTAMRDEYELTDGIQIFADDGYAVRAARVIREDVNLSYPRDLLDLNLRLLREGGRAAAEARAPGGSAGPATGCFVADGATIAAGASVHDSVVMEGARVEAGASVRECLLLPGARVTAERPLRRQIVTPDEVVDCA
jgi:NDP-sugar pyrophosphorylase family protein